MADKWGCDEADAVTRIRDGKPHIKKRREQHATFNAASSTVVAAVPGVSRGARRLLAIELMKDAMGPMARFVRLKTRFLQQRSVLVERHSALLEKMRDAVGLQDVLALVPQLDAIELEVEKANQPIAVRGRGDEQWAFCLAADYADEWSVVRRPDGSIRCAFRSFHKCTAKAGEADGCCGTVIGSKAMAMQTA